MEALAAFSEARDVVLLESALERPGVGRYSFLAAEPFQSLAIARVKYGSDPLAGVRQELDPYPAETIPDLPPFQGGAAGVFSYELGGAWERIPRSRADEFELPDLMVGLFDWVIAWDHLKRRCWI